MSDVPNIGMTPSQMTGGVGGNIETCILHIYSN